MFDQIFMDMLKDKEKVVKSLADAYAQSEKIEIGFNGVINTVLTNPSDENLRKMVNTTMKCVKTMSGIIKMLIMLNLVYVGGDQYSTDVGKILIRLGRGKEALREIFKQKLKGS